MGYLVSMDPFSKRQCRTMCDRCDLQGFLVSEQHTNEIEAEDSNQVLLRPPTLSPPPPPPCVRCQGRQVISVCNDVLIRVHAATDLRVPVVCDEMLGDEGGKLTVNLVQIVHPRFHRSGLLDLTVTQKISLADSLCGCEFQLVHLDGCLLPLVTTDVVRPGEVRTLQGLGMWDNAEADRPAVRRGNLHVTFEVLYPDAPLSAQTKQLLRMALHTVAPSEEKAETYCC